MTQQDLQNAIVMDLEQLFTHMRRENSLGTERAVNVYPQEVPIREADDEGQDPGAPPEPFVVVRILGGVIETEESPHVVDVAFIICTYDQNINRQGYRDALHIVNEIYRHYATNGIIAGKYEVRYPIEWTTQDVDTHPYYYAGLSMKVEMTAYTKEVTYI